MSEQIIEVEVIGKNPVASKSVWWNLIVTVAQAADMLSGTGLIPQPWGMVATGVVNIVLRIVTKEPLNLGTPQVLQAVVKPQGMKFVNVTPGKEM